MWVSLNTESLTEATAKAQGVCDTMVSAWEAKLAGDTKDAQARFKTARDLAKSRGFRFLPIDRVAALPADQLLERIEAVGRTRAGRPDRFDMEAILGGAARPKITVSAALDLFWTLAEERTWGKSKDQDLEEWPQEDNQELHRLDQGYST